MDGDTAQVGPEVAGQLDIPQVTHLMEGFGHIGYLYVCGGRRPVVYSNVWRWIYLVS